MRASVVGTADLGDVSVSGSKERVAVSCTAALLSV